MMTESLGLGNGHGQGGGWGPGGKPKETNTFQEKTFSDNPFYK